VPARSRRVDPPPNSDATVVYTDGACLGNPGPGGWAWAEPEGAYASGPAARTTNQRMEITAAYEAVRGHPDGPLEIVSDSTYVVNCFATGGGRGGCAGAGPPPPRSRWPTATCGSRSSSW
jgi:ribonuclease HI